MDEFSQFAGRPFEVVDVATPEVLVGGLFGVGMVFAFAGMAIAAVGRAAQRVVLICREAFKSDPGILAGTCSSAVVTQPPFGDARRASSSARRSLPNYERVVSVVTQAALSEMVAPGVLCVGAPVAVGFAGRFVGELTGRPLLGAEVLAGYLVFGTVSGTVRKSTSASGAPDNSSLSRFSAMTRPSWLGRAVRNSHRHAVEQASRRWRGGRRDDSARTRRKF